MMKRTILLAALLCAGCATQPQTPEQRAEQMRLGLEMLRMARPQAAPMRNTGECRSYWRGSYWQTVCD